LVWFISGESVLICRRVLSLPIPLQGALETAQAR